MVPLLRTLEKGVLVRMSQSIPPNQLVKMFDEHCSHMSGFDGFFQRQSTDSSFQEKVEYAYGGEEQ